MRVFLTGGTGFIGLALTAQLLQDGIEVISVAEAPPPDWAKRMLGSGVTFRMISIRDMDALTSTMRDTAPDLLIHGAALTPDERIEREEGTARIFDINVGGTANALEAAAEAGVGRVLAFSSGAVYGRTLEDTDWLDEVETQCQPTTLYAISKLAAEKVALRLGKLHGISVVIPRLSATWGVWEYQTQHRQTLSPPWQIIDAALAGTRPIVPNGAALPLIYSEDAADMLVRLAKSRADGVINVGSDQMIDLWGLAQATRKAVGRTAFEESTLELLTTSRPLMRLDHLKAAIGPLPRTGLEDALSRTIEWTRDIQKSH